MFFKEAAEFLPILLEGLRLTVVVTAGCLVLSTLLGLLWALMRVSGITPLVWVSTALVNVIRGIPIMVQLFFIYFVLPEWGVQLSALQAAIIGLGFAYSAYQAENFSAGIEAIDKGQIEAAQSIGIPLNHIWVIVWSLAGFVALFAAGLGYMVPGVLMQRRIKARETAIMLRLPLPQPARRNCRTNATRPAAPAA